MRRAASEGTGEEDQMEKGIVEEGNEDRILRLVLYRFYF
jgi:hypothetical protein